MSGQFLFFATETEIFTKYYENKQEQKPGNGRILRV
jgi:hypothetical protein